MRWANTHHRDNLPWRQTRDPYAVLVSEVMLQQTQVSRTLPYYLEWMARWPRVQDLAAASPAEVIRAWSGLGYNRRALNLHRAARTVSDEQGGVFPSEMEALRALPGIGPYTASAVASFAFELGLPVIDTNIGRVLVRSGVGKASVRDVPARVIQGVAEALLPKVDTRAHNLALMDLGAMVCRSRAPLCGECPLSTLCEWKSAGYPASTVAVVKTPRFETTARFARGRIVDWLRGTETMSSDELRARLPEEHSGRIELYLEALAREGMLEPVGGGWRLVTDASPAG